MSAFEVEVEVEVQPRVIRALESMLLIRGFEEQSAALQEAGKSPSMCTSVGQEASAVGVMNALDERDQILTNHRSAGHLLARGADPRRILAAILGKSTGYCAAPGGIFRESTTRAAVGALPVLYVCENNQGQAFVHRRETMRADHISS